VPSELAKLLENLNMAESGKLNLAGLLLFGECPQRVKPAFTLKAVHYPGVDISTEDYLDGEDFEGQLSSIFEGAMAFLRRVLPKRAAKGGVNSQARWPVPQIVFEELLVNALTHRDYFIEAPIRLFVFDNRVELVSPGSLPNHLTVEKIQAGVSVIRNPIIASFVAKGLLPYRGLGTGVRRAVSEWAAIEFRDDRDSCTFTATVALAKGHFESINEPINQKKVLTVLQKGTLGVLRDSNDEPIKDVQAQVLSILRIQAGLSYDALANELHIGRSTVMRHLRDLKKRGVIHRVGSRKSGRWEILKEPVSG
jgi:ATP-dependent DNA helicase RecG